MMPTMRSESPRFSANVGHEPGRTRLVMTGIIDESAALPNPGDKAFRFPVEIDLGSITHINSIGVRNWMKFIKPLTDRGDVTLLRCPEVMVRQFSMIFGSLGQARVRTLLAPYRCDRCGQPEVHELSMGRDVDPARYDIEPAARACGKCGAKSLFDDVAETYFAFAAVMAK
jgi:hypothetical protein